MADKIKKILIANRGEIACRVIRTCRKMGIASVAVYSDADRKALHVRMADEAVHIGPSPATESYLVIGKIIAACRQTGADAVHPGYGFLSENPEFARCLKKEGITFIGPSPESMEAMGLKDAAKKLMEKAGVPVTPGYHGPDQDGKLLKARAGMIGYPVLIKAVAGGGGKGMRKVEQAEDFDDALASARREAKAAFGDERVLIEKYIARPRHIEVQIFGDTHGNIIHMFERDCSLQRRNKKVIEEAPAPGLREEVRQAMCEAAIKAAKAVDYVGAGTVEFIVDGSGELRKDGFWFMEMNTRLQVEHPVTEMITGLDLVEWQIRVAQGEKLPKQKDIKMHGHAIEARIYAEDPANDFLPSTGNFEIFEIPRPGLDDPGALPQGVTQRVDTGIAQESEISVFYDPMIAKYIAHAASRTDAILALQQMCRASLLYPIWTNLRFLGRCLEQEAFLSGAISTGFIAEHMADLVPESLSERDCARLSSALHIMQHPEHQTEFDGWRLNLPPRNTAIIYVNGHPTEVPLNPMQGADFLSHEFTPVHKVKDGVVVGIDGMACLVQTEPPVTSGQIAAGNTLNAPMPGRIIAVNVKVGDKVKAGDKLIIMEAMKMEMTLDGPRDGVVAKVYVKPDALVADGEVLLELEDA